MNGTPTSGFFSDRGNFAAEAKPDILELAQESLQQFEDAEIALVNANPEDAYEIECSKDFYATQAQLRLDLSIAVDLRRIANTLERRHV